MPERVEQGRSIGRGRHTKKTYPRHLSRLLRVGGERRGEETHGEDSDECATPDHHAATAVCWFNAHRADSRSAQAGDAGADVFDQQSQALV
ncbi:MAG TPA: hypothetical protein VIM84_11190, partial [Gemmatimonadales bacterium]